MTDAPDAQRAAVHASPPLGILAIVFVALDLGSFAAAHAHATPVVALLRFSASIPLGLFAASMVSRLLFHRINVAGVHIALFGGFAASVFLGASALALWACGGSSEAAAFQRLAVALGGFGHVALLGLLLAGVSVPSMAFGLLPRWLCWLGLAIAAIAEVSVIAIAFPTAMVLLPSARFPSLLWLIAAGFLMPKRRRA
jgi:hypothetical protein